MNFEVAARQILGKRSSQQDAWRVIDSRGNDLKTKAENGSVTVGDRSLVIVADGVGGYAGGQEASNLACKTFIASFLSEEGPVEARLDKALGAANAQRLDSLSAELATDCFLTAQVIGHVGSAEVGNDTLGAHRLARARADAVQSSLIKDGLPAKAIASDIW